MRYLFYAFLLICMVGCSQKITQPDKFTSFKIYDLNSKSLLPYENFIDEISKKDIILLGETHDETNHHILEAKIINSLSEISKIDAVLEMYKVSSQPYLDGIRYQNLNENFSKDEIFWDEKWSYKKYEILAKNLFLNPKIKILAGNLTDDELSTIFKGALPPNGTISTSNEVRKRLSKIITSMHEMDGEILDSMVITQLYRDRRMADILVGAKNRAVLIAGRYHAFKNLGVPLHIKEFKSPKTFVVVLFGSADELVELDGESDYFIVLE